MASEDSSNKTGLSIELSKMELPGLTPPPPEFPMEMPAGESPAPEAGSAAPIETPPSVEPLEEAPAAPDPIPKMREFAEKMTIGKEAVPASYPFSLLIDGPLTPSEREKLLDILSHENMGVREVDLGPQFESGKILIPRISEYAGVLLAQALRSSRASLKLGPSDSIFSTPDTHEADPGILLASAQGQAASALSIDPQHPAEHIPLISGPSLPGGESFTVVDTVTASASLKTEVVEAEHSSEYQELLEALQRELKYKAYRKGASAVVHFSIQVNPLSLPTRYRVLAMGTAVKVQAPAAPGLS